MESGSVVVSARGKNIISSPQKLRLVADLIRGERVEKAQEILEYTNKRGAKELKKLLKSAVANAEHNFDLDPKSLVVSKLTVDEGIKMPRYRFASRGRVHKYVRRRSHVLIELSEEV
ncbi:50S ribosomal protein L22 [Candidatus Dojkabacteria bacterium]|nr:50S ribosomal protein L22 [Candidatus Dojkabacteria bacterium]